jgi:hypothetical protein
MFRVLICTVLIAASSIAAAQIVEQAPIPGRRFPDIAQRGKFEVKQPPEVTINGKEMRLAPGARIYNTQNMILMSGSIAGQTQVVNYTTDTMGLVKDVWILTPEEQRIKAPNVLRAERDKASGVQQPQPLPAIPVPKPQ